MRERTADILPLASHLLRFFAREGGKNFYGFAREAEATLLRYPWSGNVRELRNTVERGVILAAGERVDVADLPAQLGTLARPAVEVGARVTLDDLEREHVRRILPSTVNLDEAARVLGIDPSTLCRKRKRFGL